MQPVTLFFLICPKLKEKKLIEFILSQFEYCHPSMGIIHLELTQSFLQKKRR